MGKKNKSTPKPRSEYIYGTTISKVSEIIVSVNARTGDITFGNEMTNVYSEVSYERPKGPKVVSRIPQANEDLSFQSDEALLKNFDFLCAVDTNTRIIKGRKVSAVGVLIFHEATPPEATELGRYWKFNVPFCLEFVGIRSDKPENFGWVAALEQLHAGRFIKNGMRVGVVVDSDLGNINEYNHARKPVFEAFNLPPNIRLIYASADTGKDSIVNRALSVADSVSSQTLDAIEQGIAPFNEEKVDSPWYDGMRIVERRGA